MEILLKEEFGTVKANPSSSSSMLQRLGNLCGVVKNPNRRFRFTPNLSNRYQADTMCRTHQEKLKVAILVSKSALLFVQGMRPSDFTAPEEPSDYTEPQEIRTTGFQNLPDEFEPGEGKLSWFSEVVQGVFGDLKGCCCECWEDATTIC